MGKSIELIQKFNNSSSVAFNKQVCSVDLQVKKSVLQNAAKGDISRAQAIEEITVRDY